MARMRRFINVFILVGIIALSGCALGTMVKMAQEQELTVVPSPLEVHADSVTVEVSALLPLKMLKKGKVYTANFTYKSGDKTIDVGAVQFKADDYPTATTEQPKKTQSFTFAYDPAIKSGNLQVQGVASDPRNGKTKETEIMPIAEGLITTSKLVQPIYYPAYADHGYNNQEELIPTNVDIFFDQGSANLKRSEKRSTRGKEFAAFVAEKNVTRTVTITGTHSPEGTERINSGLSERRAKVIEKWYRQQMDQYDYKGIADSIKFVLKPIIEDWSAFKKAMASYDGISADQKASALSIVNGSGTFEEQEKQLQKLSVYKKIFREVYPDLRAAKTEILTVKQKKTDAQIAIIAKQLANGEEAQDSLSGEEFSYAATLTPALNEKEDIYKALIKKNDSWQAHNNLGAVYLEYAANATDNEQTKYLEMAITQFEIAGKQQKSAEVENNMGVAYLMQGNVIKAYNASKIAVGLSPNKEVAGGIKAVKGTIEVMVAEYDRAIATLAGAEETTDALFNKGLAQLLKKDFNNALITFTEVLELDGSYALAYYGVAVANARLNQQDKVFANLAKAIDNDPKLKEVAATDLEFSDYADSQGFKDALK